MEVNITPKAVLTGPENLQFVPLAQMIYTGQVVLNFAAFHSGLYNS